MFPVLLIVLGVGFLLYNLGLVPFRPWDIFWPGLLIWLAMSQLISMARRPKGQQDGGEIAIWLILLTLGVYLILPRIGIAIPGIKWSIIWPLALVLIGIAALFPGKGSWFKINFRSSARSHGARANRGFVGDFNRGPGSWALDDMNIHQSVGSVNLDLTQAIVPEREVFIDISGSVGEVSIYLPPGLPVKAEGRLSVGEITILDLNESGSGRYIAMQSADYDTATRKVNIRVRWRIGEISIRQIR